MLAVGKAEHRHLGAGHALLDDHLGSGGTEFPVRHHALDGLLGLLHGLGYHHALPQGQAVGLDDDGGTLPADVFQRGLKGRKGVVLRGGNVIFCHQALGENLAGLNDRRVFSGAEGGDAPRLHGVHHAQGQRVIRGDHDEINLMLRRPIHHGRYIGGLNGDALGQGGDTAVARGTEEGFDLRAFGQGPDEGVLAAAAANDKNVHCMTSIQDMSRLNRYRTAM